MEKTISILGWPLANPVFRGFLVEELLRDGLPRHCHVSSSGEPNVPEGTARRVRIKRCEDWQVVMRAGL